MQIQVMTIFEHEHLTSYMRKAGWRRCGINFSPLSKGVSGLLYKNGDWRVFVPDTLNNRQCRRIAEKLALAAGVLPATVTNSILEEQDEMTTETLEEYKKRVRRVLMAGAEDMTLKNQLEALDLSVVDDGPLKDEMVVSLTGGRYAVRVSTLDAEYDPRTPWQVFNAYNEGELKSSEEVEGDVYTFMKEHDYPAQESPYSG